MEAQAHDSFDRFMTNPLLLFFRFRRWLQWFSIFKFGVTAVNVNEFTGLTFICPPSGVCLYPTGEAYLAFSGFDENLMWPSIGLLLAWSCLYLVIAYIGLATKGRK